MQVRHQSLFICSKIKLYEDYKKIEFLVPSIRHRNCLDKFLLDESFPNNKLGGIAFYIRSMATPGNVKKSCTYWDSHYGDKNIILITGIQKPPNLSEINLLLSWEKKFLLEISKFKKLHLTRESPKTKYYQHYSKFDSNSFSSALSR